MTTGFPSGAPRAHFEGKRRLEHGVEFVHIEGFGKDVGVGDGFGDFGDAVVGGDEDDFGVGAFGAEGDGEIGALDFGEADVDDGDVEIFAGDVVGFFSGGAGGDVEAAVGEDGAQGVEGFGVVFDKQNAFRSHF